MNQDPNSKRSSSNLLFLKAQKLLTISSSHFILLENEKDLFNQRVMDKILKRYKFKCFKNLASHPLNPSKYRIPFRGYFRKLELVKSHPDYLPTLTKKDFYPMTDCGHISTFTSTVKLEKSLLDSLRWLRLRHLNIKIGEDILASISNMLRLNPYIQDAHIRIETENFSRSWKTNGERKQTVLQYGHFFRTLFSMKDLKSLGLDLQSSAILFDDPLFIEDLAQVYHSKIQEFDIRIILVLPFLRQVKTMDFFSNLDRLTFFQMEPYRGKRQKGKTLTISCEKLNTNPLLSWCDSLKSLRLVYKITEENPSENFVLPKTLEQLEVSIKHSHEQRAEDILSALEKKVQNLERLEKVKIDLSLCSESILKGLTRFCKALSTKTMKDISIETLPTDNISNDDSFDDADSFIESIHFYNLFLQLKTFRSLEALQLNLLAEGETVKYLEGLLSFFPMMKKLKLCLFYSSFRDAQISFSLPWKNLKNLHKLELIAEYPLAFDYNEDFANGLEGLINMKEIKISCLPSTKVSPQMLSIMKRNLAKLEQLKISEFSNLEQVPQDITP